MAEDQFARSADRSEGDSINSSDMTTIFLRVRGAPIAIYLYRKKLSLLPYSIVICPGEIMLLHQIFTVADASEKNLTQRYAGCSDDGITKSPIGLFQSDKV